MLHATIHPLDRYSVCGVKTEGSYVVGDEQDETREMFTEILGEIVMRLNCTKCKESLRIIYNHLI